MPSISRSLMVKWRNYHLTHQGQYRPQGATDPRISGVDDAAYPDGSIRDFAALHCGDIVTMVGTEMFRQIGDLLGDYVHRLVTPDPSQIVPKRPPVDCVAIGTGWSFSKLAGARDTLIDMTGASGISEAQDWELAGDCAYPRDKVALALGGTRLRELTSWAQQRNEPLSIKTSGSHLGLTIAGAIATASHGSRLGYGGIQNMIVGLHIVTGPNRSVWIERRSKPVLSEKAARSFASEIIREHDVFEDALVHLGGMGIVSGVALELVEDTGYRLLPRVQAVDEGWLADASSGSFSKLAARLGDNADPVFYELTIDPWNWKKKPAIHTMYFISGSSEKILPVPPPQLTFADNIGFISDSLIGALFPPAAFLSHSEAGMVEPDLSQSFSAFDLYKQAYLDSDMVKNPPTHARWNQLHAGEITGGYPGALYNASYAIQRSDLAEVIPRICEAVAGVQKQTFVFTVRFVSNAAGTMAFTRFTDCAVIEIDGISRNAPAYGPYLGCFIEEGARLVRECLDGAVGASAKTFDYSMHWGKLGGLDAAKIERDFGPSTDKASELSRWRATRGRLLHAGVEGGDMTRLFWNQGLVDFGLVPDHAGGAAFPDEGSESPPTQPCESEVPS